MDWQAAPSGYHLLHPHPTWPVLEPIIAWRSAHIPGLHPVGLASGLALRETAVIVAPDGAVFRGKRRWASVQAWHETPQNFITLGMKEAL